MSSHDPIPTGPALYLSVTFRHGALQGWAFRSQLEQGGWWPNSNHPGHTFLVLCHQARPQGCRPPGNCGVPGLALLWQGSSRDLLPRHITDAGRMDQRGGLSQTLGSLEMNVAGVACEGGSRQGQRGRRCLQCSQGNRETAVQVTSAPSPAVSPGLHRAWCRAVSSSVGRIVLFAR